MKIALRGISALVLILSAEVAAAGKAPQKPSAREQAVQDLVSVENDFAARAAKTNWLEAFAAYFADDGIWFTPVPQNTKEALGTIPAEAGKSKVEWFATWTDASGAGDLGFNLGPYKWSDPDGSVRPGYFFTVWKREAEGAFKVAIDFGINMSEAPAETRDDWRAAAGSDYRAKKSAARATRADLEKVEADLCAAISRDGVVSAFERHLDDDAVLLRDGRAPVREAAARLQYLESVAAQKVCFQSSQGSVAKSNDLGFTYGAFTAGTKDAKPAPAGYYLHVWRRNKKGEWKIAIDMQKDAALPPPAVAPAPAAPRPLAQS